jgi:hypothetical protein
MSDQHIIVFFAGGSVFLLFMLMMGVIYHYRYRNSDGDLLGKYSNETSTDINDPDFGKEPDWQWPIWTPSK